MADSRDRFLNRYFIRLLATALAAALLAIPDADIRAGAKQPTAKQPAAKQPAAGRPRIGLVLGGGGARGAAHVGVLKVLEEMRIPVDYVAGTSMGSIVGGLYASGMSPAEIEREIQSMDWRDLFQDEPPREDRSFRRKRDDDLYVFKVKPGFRNGEVKIPPAYVRGQKFDLQLSRLTLPVSEIKDFDQLPIPYRAVATDIETGQAVVVGKGDLAEAIRASMAVPAAFDPVEINNRLLVDGGVANNVPVNVARDMGADVIIAVDVGSGLYERDELKSALDVSAQLTGFLFTLSGDREIATLTARDVLIRPPLGDIGGGSFERADEAIPIGEQAARELRDALSRYALSPADYERHVASRKQPASRAPVIDFVRVENNSRLADSVITDRISLKPGDTLDLARLERDLGQIYGLELFALVRYDIIEEKGKTGLVVTATEKPWGPGYLQAGMAFSSNLAGDSSFKLGGIYTLTQINRLNGEWRIGAQVADEPGFFTEIYQPLDPLGRYFVQGRVGYGGKNVNVFDDAGNRLSQYFLNGWNLDLSAGREFGTWGQARLGFRRESGTVNVNTGPPQPESEFESSELYLALLDDKLDNLYFPRKGNLGLIEWRGSRDGLGADTDYDQFRLGFLQAFTRGRNTLIGRLYGATTLDDNAPLQSLFRTGGFLRLSGLQDLQLSGQHVGLAQAIYLRRIEDVQFFQAYLGGSVELGNAWQSKGAVSLDDTIFGGSVFLGLDMPIGPLYLGYGRADTGDSSIYLFLGPLFTFD